MSAGATVRIAPSSEQLAHDAAEGAAQIVRAAVAATGAARVMFASGNSQRAFLERLTADARMPWPQVTGFHMDEYVGVGADHPASFARYMQERIVDRAPVGAFHLIDGTAPATAECERYAALVERDAIDLCVMGIGENGHLAFNDPPVADFDDPLTVKVVELDDRCRRQQVGEGHFPSVDAVPPTAITVTIPALLRARRVMVIVPDARKADAVAAALAGPVTTACPASILLTAPQATVYLDPDSAAGLRSSPS
ncbi:MAG: 6-phosphogluconolactonase [Acidimicrobiia bacterium]